MDTKLSVHRIKHEEHEEIERLIQEYLERGGTINGLPPFETTILHKKGWKVHIPVEERTTEKKLKEEK